MVIRPRWRSAVVAGFALWAAFQSPWALGGWTRLEDKDLNAVWGASSSSVYAVGDAGTVKRFNGTSWSTVGGIPTSANLRGVWGTSTDVYAVGAGGVVLHFNGTSWTAMSSGVTSNLYAIWGTSNYDIWAVGAGGLTLHFNGIVWSASYTGSADALYAVWGSGGADIWAGGAGGRIWHYAGAAWAAYASPTTSSITGFWGTSATDAYATTSGGEILRLSLATATLAPGGVIERVSTVAWTVVVSDSNMSFSGVWGPSSIDVIAVGWSLTRYGLFKRWDGTYWTATDAPVQRRLNGAWGSGPGDVWAVGDGGAILHCDGASWTVVAGTPTASDLFSVWGSSVYDMWVAGGTTSLESSIGHFNGTGWESVTGIPQPGGIFRGVSGASGADVFAVSRLGDIYRYNGSNWYLSDSYSTYGFDYVWANSGTEAFAVGSSGKVLHFDGASWTDLGSGSSAWLHGGRGSLSGMCVVGDSGTVMMYASPTWVSVSVPTVANLWGVWGPSPDYLFVVGQGGTILHYDGAGWTAMASGTTQDLHAVWGYSCADVYAVGSGGTILHYDGNVWSPMASPTSQNLWGLWGDGTGNMAAVGEGGVILEYSYKPTPCTVTCSSSVQTAAFVGSPVTFRTTAAQSGCGKTKTFQWKFGDSSTSTLESPSHTYTAPGTYTWVSTVKVNCEFCTSTGTIVVSVCDPASVAAGPVSQTVLSGQSAVLDVTASGTSPFSYSWYEGRSGDTSKFTGAASRVFNTPPLTATTSYWARVSNSCGTADSPAATVTVRPPCEGPAIVVGPSDTEACKGATVALTVEATGSPLLRYRWYEGGQGDVSNPVGSDSPNFVSKPVFSNTQFWVRVSNSCGSAESAAANVTIAPSTSILQQPADGTVQSGNPVVLSVGAVGRSPHYQWFEGVSPDRSRPAGTDSSTFTTAPLYQSSSFWVEVAGECGTVASRAAVVTVVVGPVTEIVVNSTDDPPDEALFTGETVTLRRAILLAEAQPPGGPVLVKFDPSLSPTAVVRVTRPLPAMERGRVYVDGSFPASGGKAQPGQEEVRSGPSFNQVRVVAAWADIPDPLGAAPIWAIRSGGNVLRNLTVGGGDALGVLFDTPLADQNKVLNCSFGADPSGKVPSQQLRLSCGIVMLNGARGNVVGEPQAGNIISNSVFDGVLLKGAEVVNNRVQSNEVGVPKAFSAPGNRVGIHIMNASDNIVGGPDASWGNSVSGNTFSGVLVQDPEASGNLITRNSFSDNGYMAIDISSVGGFGDGPDDVQDQALGTGPNRRMPSPVLTEVGASGGLYTLSGLTVPGAVVEAYRAAVSASGFGEGEKFLAETVAGKDGRFTLTADAAAGESVTLLAHSGNNTSEFSQAVSLALRDPSFRAPAFYPLSHVFLLPKGAVRRFGVHLAQRPSAETVTLETDISNSSIASGPATLSFPPGTAGSELALTGAGAGATRMRLRDVAVPNTFVGAVVMCDAAAVVGSLNTTLDDSLDGPIPFRVYQVDNTAAGNILTLTVRPKAGSPLMPAVAVFQSGPKCDTFVSDFQVGKALQVQIPLSGSGRYYLAVGDLYLRQGGAFAYRLEIKARQSDISDEHPPLSPQAALDAGGKPNCFAFGDINGDGWADMVVAIPKASSIRVFIKLPGESAGFREPLTRDLGFVPGTVALADLNRDGKADIIVSHAGSKLVTVIYSSEWFSKVSTDGAEVRTFPAAVSGNSSLTADFNSDAYPDYAVLDSSSNSLQIFLNDRAGNLLQNQVLPVGSSPTVVRSGDLNRDGNIDLVVANTGANSFDLLKGKGDGRFELALRLADIPDPVDVAIGDFDLDGTPDLAAISGSSGGVRTWKGLGNFNFQVQQALVSGPAPGSMGLQDLNLDGRLDIAVSCADSIWIYQGFTLGVFAPVAKIDGSGNIVQLLWYSFGVGGSYFGVSPDQNFIQVLQGTYNILDFGNSESGGPFDAAYAVANPSDAEALVYLTLYNSQGTPVKGSSSENSVVLSVPPFSQSAFYAKEVFQLYGELSGVWLRAASLNKSVQGFSLLVSRENPIRLDGSPAQSASAPRVFLPDPRFFDTAAEGRCSILNPNSGPVSVSVSCRRPDGGAMNDPWVFTLPPNGCTMFNYREQFPFIIGYSYMDVQADQPVEAFMLAGDSESWSAVPGIPFPADSAAKTTIYSAHFAEGKYFRSTLDLVQTGDAAAKVAVRILKDTGQILAQAQYQLKPMGMVRLRLEDILGPEAVSQDVVAGYVAVESDRSGTSGVLTFSDRQSGIFSSSIPLQRSGGDRWLFSHLAVGQIGGVNYFTGITILNIGTAEAPVTLTVYDQAGQIRGTAQFSVPAGQKISRLLTEWITLPEAQAGGYITLVSAPGASLCTFELFGDGELNFLSAVMAQPMVQ